MFCRCVTDYIVQRVASVSKTNCNQRRVVPLRPGFCHRLFSVVGMLCFAAAAILLLSPPPSWAQTSDWVLPAGQSGDWSVASNWDNGVPTYGISAYIANGGEGTLSLSAACTYLYLGGTNTGTFQIAGGSLILQRANLSSIYRLEFVSA